MAQRTDYGTQYIKINGDAGVAGLHPTAVYLAARRNSAGPPTTGTWVANTLIYDSNGDAWWSTAGGTPGTWILVSGPSKISGTLVDAKGDILTATADNTPARLPVGPNDSSLVADSDAATGQRYAFSGGAPYGAVNIGATLENWVDAQQYTGPLQILVVGDSISAGFSASNGDSTDWVHLFRTEMRNRFGNGGTGFIPIHWAGAFPEGAWTFSGAWTQASNNSFAPYGRVATSTGTGQTATLAATNFHSNYQAGFGGCVWDKLEIFCLGTALSYTFTTNIDGAGAVTQTIPAGANVLNKVTLTAKLGSHSLVISTTGANPTTLIGANALITMNAGGTGNEGNGSMQGVVVHRCAFTGTKISDLVSPTSRMNVLKDSSGLNPTLVIACFGVNDAFNQIALATYDANLTALITRMRDSPPAFTSKADVLFHSALQPRNDYSPITLRQYWDQMRKNSYVNNVPFMDSHKASNNGVFFQARMENDPNPGGGVFSIHPNDQGHSFVAANISSVVQTRDLGEHTQWAQRQLTARGRMLSTKIGKRRVSGRYITPEGAVATITLTNNRLYYIPIFVDTYGWFDTISFNLAAAATLATTPVLKFAFFHDAWDQGQFPGILDNGTAVSQSIASGTAVGVKTVNIPGQPRPLDPGLNWIAVGCSGMTSGTAATVSGMTGMGPFGSQFSTFTANGSYGRGWSLYAGTIPTDARTACDMDTDVPLIAVHAL